MFLESTFHTLKPLRELYVRFRRAEWPSIAGNRKRHESHVSPFFFFFNFTPQLASCSLSILVQSISAYPSHLPVHVLRDTSIKMIIRSIGNWRFQRYRVSGLRDPELLAKEPDYTNTVNLAVRRSCRRSCNSYAIFTRFARTHVFHNLDVIC